MLIDLSRQMLAGDPVTVLVKNGGGQQQRVPVTATESRQRRDLSSQPPACQAG